MSGQQCPHHIQNRNIEGMRHGHYDPSVFAFLDQRSEMSHHLECLTLYMLHHPVPAHSQLAQCLHRESALFLPEWTIGKGDSQSFFERANAIEKAIRPSNELIRRVELSNGILAGHDDEAIATSSKSNHWSILFGQIVPDQMVKAADRVQFLDQQ